MGLDLLGFAADAAILGQYFTGGSVVGKASDGGAQPDYSGGLFGSGLLVILGIVGIILLSKVGLDFLKAVKL